MGDVESDYESGLVLCLEEHRRLARLNPAHELLKYGDVREEDEVFVYHEEHLDEAAKRFSKDGKRPRGIYACAYMITKHFAALKQAVDEIEQNRPQTVQNS